MHVVTLRAEVEDEAAAVALADKIQAAAPGAEVSVQEHTPYVAEEDGAEEDS